MNVAIIPARGGSKRIPGKNIKDFHGKPIISYSIEAAIRSELFDKVVVSTDSEKIADIAREVGAEVPFLRPKAISDDVTPMAPVLKHALNWFLKNKGYSIRYACCIAATAPFVRIKDLVHGFNLIQKGKASTVFSVARYDYPISRALKISDNGNIRMIWPENELVRSQDFPEAHHDAVQFYFLDAKKFMANSQIYTLDALPVILPRYLVHDIDTMEDWDIAEAMFETIKGKD
jgi:pseudaminic acid cytidylyltransferase|tara:strand:+ start:4115 stop:4810 length:696 start_codon:yes stop_codon:yes gene_type:complete